MCDDNDGRAGRWAVWWCIVLALLWALPLRAETALPPLPPLVPLVPLVPEGEALAEFAKELE